MCHELGHIIICLIFKRKIELINIYPFGGLIILDGYISSNIYEDILISCGGILVQLLLGLIIDNSDFDYYNNLIILFNLMPIRPLDGEKILNLIISIFRPFKTSLYVSLFLSWITFLLGCTFKFDIIQNNSLVILFIVFNHIKYMRDIKYIMNRFYLERCMHKFKFKRSIWIDDKSDMYKNRLNMINGLREDIYLQKYFR